MNKLTFNSQEFTLKQYETVLECLLRNAQSIPYACKAGMCQACLIKAVNCDATDESKKWIKAELQKRGFTLACQWVPDTDVAAELPGIEDFSINATIHSLHLLNPDVMQVMLSVAEPARMFTYRPGQYLTLINPEGITRSYSIANDFNQEGLLELHISRTTHGLFSGWIFNTAAIGTPLHVRGPAGDCCYEASEAADKPLLLAATGTGLAPLYGILRDALNQGHSAPVRLFHGGRNESQLYYQEALQALAAKHDNFDYIPCSKELPQDAAVTHGAIEAVIDETLDTQMTTQAHAYLCGAPDFVHGLRKHLFLKGIRSANIHCDAFTERTVVAIK